MTQEQIRNSQVHIGFALHFIESGMRSDCYKTWYATSARIGKSPKPVTLTTFLLLHCQMVGVEFSCVSPAHVSSSPGFGFRPPIAFPFTWTELILDHIADPSYPRGTGLNQGPHTIMHYKFDIRRTLTYLPKALQTTQGMNAPRHCSRGF